MSTIPARAQPPNGVAPSLGMLILVWAITVLAALAPLAVSALLQWFLRRSVSWEEITQHGELFLVSVGICAGAIGDLMLGRRAPRTRAVMGTLAGIALCAGLLAYAILFSLLQVFATMGMPIQMDAAMVTSYGNYYLVAAASIAISSRIVGGLS